MRTNDGGKVVSIETIEPEEIMDTKEYDINAIINKAKQGKNVMLERLWIILSMLMI